MIIWIIIVGVIVVWVAGYLGGWKFSRAEQAVDIDAKAMADMGARSENAIRDAMRRNPKSIFPASAWVDLAVAENNWPEALRRAHLFMAMFPKRPEGAAAVGRVLALSGRDEESDAFLESKLGQFKSQPALYIEYAENARRRGNLEEAGRRIQPALRKSPDAANAYLIAVSLCLSAGKFDEAEALLLEGEKAVGSGEGFFGPVPRAEIASHRKEWRQAAELWSEARMGQPTLPTCYFRGSAALRELGNLDAANDLITMGAEKFPDNPDIREEKERVARQVQERNESAAQA
jgi:predicted Zn-dependent protease